MIGLTSFACALALVVPWPGAGDAQAAAPARQPPPGGWQAARDRDSALGLESRHKERIAILEGWVKRHPGFPDAHARLGGAYESLGREMAAARPSPDIDAALKNFELAITHLRRALELGGDEYHDITIRALADLYVLLRRPAERATFVRAAVQQFPATPRAHVEVLRLLVEDGKLAEAEAGILAAQKAIPRTADALHELVEGLWPDIEALPDSAAQRRLAARSAAIIDEALKLDPRHPFAPMTREEILRDQAKRAKDPALFLQVTRQTARFERARRSVP